VLGGSLVSSAIAGQPERAAGCRTERQSAGILGVAYCRDALHRGWPRMVDDQILKGHDTQLTVDHVE
jgi:hypothetical protein